ncbi:PPOX class F420-dependent oxidoreductase [Cellulomonas chitinilytica]|uniref:PPOX class F420-dependent oxidoreductase n=1 Tax=Cellulomonas chitinilytica TaxID=398759 RepID=A0A919U1D3_9CELL|nr:TIGR03668 family PPOX class F420-dependent oxidoreductase [Cellulomonas chitinilytica]GIG21276.1 PPOX class F420-dependent oxidoreductase [Cellulomonas chitinilytica]
MDPASCRHLFADARRAVLATTGAGGEPHLVPVTFALLDDDVVVHAVDHKPKRTTDLRRLRNIADNPQVAFLVDRYDDDWSALWWVRADADAVVVAGGPQHEAAVAALVGRYPQYRALPPTGPVVWASVRRWSGWSGSG